jgi:CHAT domain
MSPNELLEKLVSLQNMMLLRATGGTPSDDEYEAIRKELVSDATIRSLLPHLVVNYRDLSQFWGFIKQKFARYEERRNYIRGEFAPLLTKLEGISPGFPEEQFEEYLRNVEPIRQSQSRNETGTEIPTVPHQEAVTQRASQNPIRVLFLAANPTNTPSLRLDQEMRAIDQALRQSEFRDRFDIKQHWAVRIIDIQGYLLRHQPDIVHFSGHGSGSREIMLEDESGKSHPVSVRALSQLFSILKDNIRCVVLNACYSEDQGKAIAEHIECVVGMSNAIADQAAIAFASAFYQALGFGRDVQTAFDLGCVQIALESLSEHDTPKLIALRGSPKDVIFAYNARALT